LGETGKTGEIDRRECVTHTQKAVKFALQLEWNNVVGADHAPKIVDAFDTRAVGAREIDNGKADAGGEDEAVESSGKICSRDLACIVDIVGPGLGDRGKVDRGEVAAREQEPVERINVPVPSHDLAGVVDAGGNSYEGAGEIDRREGDGGDFASETEEQD